MELLSGFIGSYLHLSDEEEADFQNYVNQMDSPIREEIQEMISYWTEKGREPGIQEGILQGRLTGICRDMATIVRIMSLRFKDTSQTTIVDLIEPIFDIEILGNLIVQAAIVPSFEEFESLVKSQYELTHPRDKAVFENSQQRTTLYATDWGERGRKQGIEQGILQSQEEEIVRVRANTQRILEARFANSPSRLMDLLEEINDIAQLRNILLEVATIPSRPHNL